MNIIISAEVGFPKEDPIILRNFSQNLKLKIKRSVSLDTWIHLISTHMQTLFYLYQTGPNSGENQS